MLSSKAKKILSEILSEKEIRVYENAMQLPGSVQELAKKSGIDRVQAYQIVKDLSEKGLITQEVKKHGRLILAEHPKKLIQILGNKQRRLRREELALQEMLPEILGDYNVDGFKPRVKFYEGKEGYKQVAEDALNIIDQPKELLTFINTDNLYEILDRDYEYGYFIPERVKRGIIGKGLMRKTENSDLVIKDNKKFLRETKFIPEDVNLNITAYVYQNKVALFTSKKELSVLLIESKEIYEFFRSLFYNIWNSE